MSLVRSTKNDRTYARKEIIRSSVVRSSDKISVNNEIQVQSTLDHTFITKIYSTKCKYGKTGIIMEYVSGLPLSDLITFYTKASKTLDSDNARTVMAQVLVALQHMRTKNICYADLKPQNTMLDMNGTVKLIDFGSARTIKEDNSCSILEGENPADKGTPLFCAPEIFNNQKVSFAADYWSFVSTSLSRAVCFT